MSWAVIVPLAMFFAGIAMSSVGWAMVEDDEHGRGFLERLRKEVGSRSIAKLAARSEIFGDALRALGLHRAAWLIDVGPVVSIVGAALGVVSTAAVLTVG